ncbi:Branched-chain-amino-acid aminotransferase [Anoxybacillus sp. P3H1B]|uniref:aminodeoxychorismate lyase n=1 Tax=Anoxybacillus sp. P3H1B TaxID=1769293 RepID=UPI000795DBB3|nr:aminodeoxychorismate lyase [Anoxybacillus sp. P3H1B]KXG08242.1 Branched-chain-amino-acid aminotransferase [Anoxybacillus sp. P3H1B]
MYVYINGKVIPNEQARISPFDHGFMYGLGVFETFRTYNRHPFLLDDHLARLHKSLVDMQIRFSVSREETIAIIQQLLAANRLEDAYIRLNISAGIGDIGLQIDAYTEPTVIVYMKSLPEIAVKEKMCTILKTRRNSPEGETRLKSHHYFNNVLGKREMRSHPHMEGIFLNHYGFLAEGIVSNLFWVKDGIVYTPALETGILNGVTRQFVMAMLGVSGIRCEEGLYTLKDLEQAEEVFLTNSIQEIVPVSRIDHFVYPGERGVFVQSLKAHYACFTHSLWTRYQLTERISMEQ